MCVSINALTRLGRDFLNSTRVSLATSAVIARRWMAAEPMASKTSGMRCKRAVYDFRKRRIRPGPCFFSGLKSAHHADGLSQGIRQKDEGREVNRKIAMHLKGEDI
jgi:hypothetical protein